MNNIKILFSMICIIAYLIPAYGQNDTLTTDGLYLKYNIPSYQESDMNVSKLTKEKIKNKDLHVSIPKDSDIERGELDRQTKCIGLTYKALPQYIISEMFYLLLPPVNPIELCKTANDAITSQWIHKDGECILFIKCSGGEKKLITNKSINKDGKYTLVTQWVRKEPGVDKSIDKMPETIFNKINYSLGMEQYLTRPMTEEQIQRVKKRITIWSPEKSKETFNAQYVITYPIENKKSIYMDKYTHKQDLIMVKWGEHLTVSFLVTKKGNKNIDKYIKEVEEAFWFED